MNRRSFLQFAGAAAAAGGNAPAEDRAGIAVERGYNPGAPVTGAIQQLERALTPGGVAALRRAGFVIEVQRPDARWASEGVRMAAGNGSQGLVLTSGDERGLSYALLELADRAQGATDVVMALRPAITDERPANRARSVARLFTSDVEDKPWYNDREMWPQYFTMLAGHRFNRFNLSFGIGYDFLQNVTDAYFLFTYPFMLAVPG
jgi:hypothetical protein